MHSQLIYLFLATIISSLLYPFWIGFVYRYQMGEEIRGDGPQTHLRKHGTPTMGGMVFILTVSAITFMFNRSRTQTLFPIFIASMAGFFGLIEDFSEVYRQSGLRTYFRFSLMPRFFSRGVLSKVYLLVLIPWNIFKEFCRVIGSKSDGGLQTYQKFLIQGIIAGFVSFWTFYKLGWDFIWFPLIGNVHVGVLYPIIIFFLFVSVLNFVAFTDGVDGLAGGLGIIAFCAYWVVALALGYNSLATLSATFVGALLPFLYFNVYPARIFMGNVGSHVLGATLVVLAVVMHREVALLFICAVYLIDGLTSPLQQLSVKLTGKRLFRMAPVHHHFEVLGWPETKVTVRFWLFGTIFAFLGILIALF